MSINFDALLSDEQKRTILTQRLNQFVVEAYQVTLNIRVAEANGDENSVIEGNKTLAVLENAVVIYTEELNSVPVTEVVE
jgi:hypothetical protein